MLNEITGYVIRQSWVMKQGSMKQTQLVGIRGFVWVAKMSYQSIRILLTKKELFFTTFVNRSTSGYYYLYLRPLIYFMFFTNELYIREQMEPIKNSTSFVKFFPCNMRRVFFPYLWLTWEVSQTTINTSGIFQIL